MKTNTIIFLFWLVVSFGTGKAQSPADPAEAFRQRITAKVERVKEGVQTWMASGRDPAAILKAMQETVKPLFDDGKATEAEAELDRLLERLGGEKPLPADEKPLAGSEKSRAADDYQAFQNPERVVVKGYDGEVVDPFISRDGHYLFFNTTHFEPSKTALYYADRIDDLTFVYKGKIGGVNLDGVLTAVSSMDRDGNFYFISPRSHEGALATIHRGKFKDGVVTDIRPVLGLNRPGQISFDVEITADGSTLYFVDATMSGSKAPGAGPKSSHLAIAIRDGDGVKRLQNSAELLAKVNTTENLEYGACTSADGLELFFDRFTVSSKSFGIWRAVRTSVGVPFGTPQRVAALDGFVEAQTLSPDGRSLYYQKREGDRFVFYRVTRAAADLPAKK